MNDATLDDTLLYQQQPTFWDAALAALAPFTGTLITFIFIFFLFSNNSLELTCDGDCHTHTHTPER